MQVRAGFRGIRQVMEIGWGGWQGPGSRAPVEAGGAQSSQGLEDRHDPWGAGTGRCIGPVPLGYVQGQPGAEGTQRASGAWG